MPAVTMPSPASRYEGSTWREITLDDSLEELWSFSSPILTGQLLLLRFLSALHSCQLSMLIQTKLLPIRRAQYCLSFNLCAAPKHSSVWYVSDKGCYLFCIADYWWSICIILWNFGSQRLLLQWILSSSISPSGLSLCCPLSFSRQVFTRIQYVV